MPCTVGTGEACVVRPLMTRGGVSGPLRQMFPRSLSTRRKGPGTVNRASAQLREDVTPYSTRGCPGQRPWAGHTPRAKRWRHPAWPPAPGEPVEHPAPPDLCCLAQSPSSPLPGDGDVQSDTMCEKTLDPPISLTVAYQPLWKVWCHQKGQHKQKPGVMPQGRRTSCLIRGPLLSRCSCSALGRPPPAGAAHADTAQGRRRKVT